jgi:hypothetical protein
MRLVRPAAALAAKVIGTIGSSGEIDTAGTSGAQAIVGGFSTSHGSA